MALVGCMAVLGGGVGVGVGVGTSSHDDSAAALAALGTALLSVRRAPTAAAAAAWLHSQPSVVGCVELLPNEAMSFTLCNTNWALKGAGEGGGTAAHAFACNSCSCSFPPSPA
eukprot:1158142-Pelagomonas_calceolata.AAC.1